MNELFYVYFFTFFHVIVFHIFQKWLKDVYNLSKRHNLLKRLTHFEGYRPCRPLTAERLTHSEGYRLYRPVTTKSKGHQISNSQLLLMVSKDLTWKFSIET